ncbi:type IV pilin protein [Chromatiaceae bacterium AAb-1]|nr:type IV pilin protein [Chromatiaceae bacterium AAb-1]
MQQQKAFTLPELIMVLAIISILSALSYPAYQQYLLQSYRSEAVQVLLLLANRQEQWLADYGAYSDNLETLGLAAPYLSRSGRYRFSVALADNGNGYLLTAQAVALQQQDTLCPVFTLNQYGQRNAQLPEAGDCW